MHPTISYQIATLEAAELHRRADRRHLHAPARRSRRHATSSGLRSSLVQAWTALTTLRGA